MREAMIMKEHRVVGPFCDPAFLETSMLHL